MKSNKKKPKKAFFILTHSLLLHLPNFRETIKPWRINILSDEHTFTDENLHKNKNKRWWIIPKKFHLRQFPWGRRGGGDNFPRGCNFLGAIFWGKIFQRGNFTGGNIPGGGTFLGGHSEHRKARDLDAANQPQSFSKDARTSANNYSILIASLLLLFYCGRKIWGLEITSSQNI